jgi:hypothetical protein
LSLDFIVFNGILKSVLTIRTSIREIQSIPIETGGSPGQDVPPASCDLSGVNMKDRKRTSRGKKVLIGSLVDGRSGWSRRQTVSLASQAKPPRCGFRRFGAGNAVQRICLFSGEPAPVE